MALGPAPTLNGMQRTTNTPAPKGKISNNSAATTLDLTEGPLAKEGPDIEL